MSKLFKGSNISTWIIFSFRHNRAFNKLFGPPKFRVHRRHVHFGHRIQRIDNGPTENRSPLQQPTFSRATTRTNSSHERFAQVRSQLEQLVDSHHQSPAAENRAR